MEGIFKQIYTVKNVKYFLIHKNKEHIQKYRITYFEIHTIPKSGLYL